jgi:hypothetical protein
MRKIEFFNNIDVKRDRPGHWKRRPDMDYFAGLDISMDETNVCVLDREGVVIHESKTASTADAITGELAKASSCRRIVFETGPVPAFAEELPPITRC